MAPFSLDSPMFGRVQSRYYGVRLKNPLRLRPNTLSTSYPTAPSPHAASRQPSANHRTNIVQKGVHFQIALSAPRAPRGARSRRPHEEGKAASDCVSRWRTPAPARRDICTKMVHYDGRRAHSQRVLRRPRPRPPRAAATPSGIARERADSSWGGVAEFFPIGRNESLWPHHARRTPIPQNPL